MHVDHTCPPFTAYYQHLRPQQLSFYRLYQRKANKMNFKVAKLTQLTLTISDIYHLLFEFVQLIYLNAESEVKLCLSKNIAQQGQQVFFLYQKSDKIEVGFREVNLGKWQKQICLMWKDLQQVTVKDLNDPSCSAQQKQISKWIEQWINKQQLGESQETNNKQKILQFMQKSQVLQLSASHNISCLLKAYLLIPQILQHSELTYYLSTHQELFPLRTDRDILKEKRQEYHTLVEHLRQLIRYLDHYGLIVHSDHETDNMTVEEKQHFHGESYKDKIQEHIYFSLRVDAEKKQQHLKQSQKSDKKWIQVNIILSLHELTINLSVKTSPFWKIYSQNLSILNEELFKIKQDLTKWMLSQQINCFWFDLFRLELQSGINMFQSVAGLEQNIKVLPDVGMAELVIGSLDRQLALWAIWHEYLQESNLIWASSVQSSSAEPRLKTKTSEQLKSILRYLNQQMVKIFK